MRAPHRQIKKLKWARFTDFAPHKKPDLKKVSSSIRDGHVYEEKVAQYLAAVFGEDNVKHGQWVEFCDANGPGMCQPDIIVEKDGRVAIIECKLTARKTARKQLEKLYAPVLRHIYKKRKLKLVQATSALTLKCKDEIILKNLNDIFDPKCVYQYAIIHLVPPK